MAPTLLMRQNRFPLCAGGLIITYYRGPRILDKILFHSRVREGFARALRTGGVARPRPLHLMLAARYNPSVHAPLCQNSDALLPALICLQARPPSVWHTSA